jgi:protocatechuate 3,4-dioxygenase beta subunit
MDGAVSDAMTDTAPEVFAARLAQLGDTRLPRALATVSRHLAALAAELQATPDDLRHAIAFLTEVGHSTDARRQEWVLLADVLGLSSLIEDRANPLPAGATPGTLPGPFYRADAPDLPDGASIALDGKGEPLRVAARVEALDGTPLRGAMAEVWQANADGLYENQQPDLQPEFNLRGRFRTDATGRFRFATIRPGGYALPSDGPVGRLLAGLGYPLDRPAHLHVRLSAPGYRTLVTHVFDRADPAIAHDALFCVKPGLLADFRRVSPPGAPSAWALDLSFTLAPASPAT